MVSNKFLIIKQKAIEDWCTDFRRLFSSLSDCNFPKLHSWRYHAGWVQIKSFTKNCIYDLHLTVTFLVPAIRKYGALNGLSTETYETLHKYYIKNPYRSSNRKDVMRQLVNAVS